MSQAEKIKVTILEAMPKTVKGNGFCVEFGCDICPHGVIAKFKPGDIALREFLANSDIPLKIAGQGPKTTVLPQGDCAAANKCLHTEDIHDLLEMINHELGSEL